ncbi:hypothetical protein TRICI_004195 [Trichomonascus ciferrii]|uniref:Inorganic pyrophosphatase n=1 Tax=Trichomonascus ciferrii TaxID=44093 RepID=A0A642V1T4_9ASCO|nr:hypothetical protein TRICI_004195 [Trichomonascus ciferrii]
MFRRGLLARTVRGNSIGLRFSSSYRLHSVGRPGSSEYRAYLCDGEKPASFFHDVPLRPAEEKDDVFNMVVEIPRWTNAKLEISKEIAYNPIVQDTKKNKPRFVSNVFPFLGYMHNYGALPQTWEDPTEKCPFTGNLGDNDPIDVCEIGQSVLQTGQIKQVKVVGVLALLDEGETDWKVLAIDTADPLSNEINDIDDVQTAMPGLLEQTRNWFRNYKIPDGKPANEFAFNGEFKNKQFALDVIKHTARSWNKLINNGHSGISCLNTTLQDSPHFKKPSPEDLPNPDSASEPNLDLAQLQKWHYVK